MMLGFDSFEDSIGHYEPVVTLLETIYWFIKVNGDTPPPQGLYLTHPKGRIRLPQRPICDFLRGMDPTLLRRGSVGDTSEAGCSLHLRGQVLTLPRGPHWTVGMGRQYLAFWVKVGEIRHNEAGINISWRT